MCYFTAVPQSRKVYPTVWLIILRYIIILHIFSTLLPQHDLLNLFFSDEVESDDEK